MIIQFLSVLTERFKNIEYFSIGNGNIYTLGACASHRISSARTQCWWVTQLQESRTRITVINPEETLLIIT